MAPPGALIVLYPAMRSNLQRRICMVVEIVGKPSVFFHRQLENTVVDEPFLSLFIDLNKTKQQRPCAHPWAGLPHVGLGISA